jgi:hypothetical protein
MEIRKLITIIEETLIDGKPAARPVRKVAAIAVIKNPLAGTYSEDLTSLTEEFGGPLGTLLAERALKALDVPAAEVESFGKGGVVGMKGEQEHASAILHAGGDPSMGVNVRKVIGGGTAIIRSAEKKAGPGVTIDIPVCFRFAERVRSHYDSMEIRLTDYPRDDEIAIIVVLTNGGRPAARIGGLRKEDIKGVDGLN